MQQTLSVSVCVFLSFPARVKNGRIALSSLLKAIHVVFLVCLPMANLRLFENLNQPAEKKAFSLPVHVTAAFLLPVPPSSSLLFIMEEFYY